jgi:hypothetical protein
MGAHAICFRNNLRDEPGCPRLALIPRNQNSTSNASTVTRVLTVAETGPTTLQ